MAFARLSAAEGRILIAFSLHPSRIAKRGMPMRSECYRSLFTPEVMTGSSFQKQERAFTIRDTEVAIS